MSEESRDSASEETRIRRALTDLTNLSNKRGISSVLGESGKTIAYEDDSRVKFSKRLCLVVDDLVKGNVSPVATNKYDDKNSDEVSKEIYFEPGDRYGARELNAAANVNRSGVVTAGDVYDARELSAAANVDRSGVVTEGLDLSVLSGNSGNCQGLRLCANVNQTGGVVTAGGEGLGLSVLGSDAEREKPGVVSEDLAKCQNLRLFEMSRCSNVDKNELVCQNVGDDLLKTCSCSFCLKAAYIWSDLHYQDIKGRLFALKKSQKEASNLILRNDKERPTDLHASLNSASSAKLESDLMGQWRSLFLSMGDILAQESNQLEKSFLTMKERREDCKVDLERETKTPQRNNI